MGDINRALGGGSELDFDGQTYKLSPWNYGIQAEFERYLEKEAFKALGRLRPFLSEEEYQDQLNRLQRDVAVGLYTFGSPLVVQAMRSAPHFKHVVLLMLKPNHPQATRELAGRMVDADPGTMIAKVAEANADPTTWATLKKAFYPENPEESDSPANQETA